MGHTVIDAADVEPSFGVFRKMRIALGATGFGINQVELPPGAEGREHDEAEGGQEEVYIVLSGSGVMRIDGELRSRVSYNADLPASAVDIAHLVAHEAYPGHHTEDAWKDVELVQGRWLRVDPAHTRRPVAGPDGMTLIMVGGTPGQGFVPRNNL